MAGLIQEQMPAPAEQPMPQQPMPEQAMPGQDPAMMQQSAEMEDEDPNAEGELNENDPGFRAALEFSMKALYEDGAAQGVAEALTSAPDPVQGLADTAYEIVSISTERVEQEIDPETLPLLAILVLTELGDIGEAAGVAYEPAQIAEALKQMILRFLQEQGADTSELQAAMDQVDPSAFNAAAQEEGMPAPQEEMPV
jgi:hypothetical protein